jgi:hypothetical protein
MRRQLGAEQEQGAPSAYLLGLPFVLNKTSFQIVRPGTDWREIAITLIGLSEGILSANA